VEALACYATKESRLVIGLMSGTSADGIDAALCRVSGSGETMRVSLEAFVCRPYAPEFRRSLMALFTPEARVGDVARVNVALGREFAEAAREVARQAGVALSEVDLIASHGQTICHLPAEGATVQIAEPAVIAEITGVMVVADFRPRDMAAGGQGAPLVPYADWVLFRHPEKTRAVQNLGGIANVTVLPAGGGLAEVIAFDTGPGNMVIDAVVSRLSHGEAGYDRDGEWAARGEVDEALLADLMRHPFLALPPPKSTGREEFGEAFATRLLEAAGKRRAEDLVATVTAFTAVSIAAAYRDFVFPRWGVDEVILGGGGSYNRTLRRWLAERLPHCAVRTHEDFGINGEAKEAIAFALLGNETVLGVPANVPSATGARHAVILGKIVLP